MKPLERGIGLDSEFLDERLTRVAEGLKRLCLTAGAVERKHQLTAHALPQRIVHGELAKLGHKARVATEVEVRGDTVLEHRNAELFEPADLGLRKRLVAEVGERAPTPQRQSTAENLGGATRVAGSQRFPPGGREIFEALEVELAPAQPQHIAGRPCYEQLARLPGPAGGFEPLPKSRHRHLQRVGAVRLPVFGPQRGDQPVARHDLVRVQQQQRQ